MRESAVIASGGDSEHGVNVKVKKLDREFANNGLAIVNYESKNNLKVINSNDSDSEHQSEDPVEGAETLNLNNSVQAQSMQSTS